MHCDAYAHLSMTEINLLGEIAMRGSVAFEEEWGDQAYAHAFLTLATCHAFVCPLRLRDLLNAPILDFMHEIRGIRINLAPRKRLLKGNFLPAYAAAIEAAA